MLQYLEVASILDQASRVALKVPASVLGVIAQMVIIMLVRFLTNEGF